MFVVVVLKLIPRAIKWQKPGCPNCQINQVTDCQKVTVYGALDSCRLTVCLLF